MPFQVPEREKVCGRRASVRNGLHTSRRFDPPGQFTSYELSIIGPFTAKNTSHEQMEDQALNKVGAVSERMQVAQYLRMSTEHQQYSTENQAHAILRYATEQSMVIVRTYADHGKSGLSLDGRFGLQQLLSDARAAAVEFAAILVYDVSRWGRFQNPDQAASYEYELSTRGIVIHYCAEQFNNDGSLSAALLKTVKRGMAGEYSRELSVKVWAGQTRLIERGFRQGGPAGYGLRRQLVDHEGNFKQILVPCQRKSLLTDRVILVPGPEHEIEIVKEIYTMFVEQRFAEKKIARTLEARGVVTETGSAWSRGLVHTILTNHKYIGWNVFNRSSFKLKKERVRNPPESWVHKTEAFKPIVSHDLFKKAQDLVAERHAGYTDERLLELLRRYIEHHGHVNTVLIDRAEELPSSALYATRFGSVVRAYELVGWSNGRSYKYLNDNLKAHQHRIDLLDRLVAQLTENGASVVLDPVSQIFTVNAEYTLRAVVAPCRKASSGSNRWTVRLDQGPRPDILLVARLQTDNESVLDYFMFPRAFAHDLLRLEDQNPLSIDIFRSPDFSQLLAMSRRKAWSLT